MASVSLFWNANMTAVTSCENALLDCCFREGVYHDSSWFSRKRLFALQMCCNSWQGLKIATRPIWLHNLLRSPRPVNEFRTISASIESSRSSCACNILHARQAEVFLEFPRKNSSRPSKSCRSIFRNVTRFQI